MSMNRAEPVTPQLVAGIAKGLGRDLTEDQAKGLSLYLGLVVEWNRKVNLVGMKSWRDILANLVSDSWHLADFLEGLDLPGSPLTLDIGAGAGLPGIPLRMFWTAGDYRLVEPRQKRASFMQYALSRLKLPDTHVFAGRAEELPLKLRDADLVVSRAFKPWPELLDTVRQCTTGRGQVVVMSLVLPSEAEAGPRGYVPAARYEYEVAGKRRYFSSFMPASFSR